MTPCPTCGAENQVDDETRAANTKVFADVLRDIAKTIDALTARVDAMQLRQEQAQLRRDVDELKALMGRALERLDSRSTPEVER